MPPHGRAYAFEPSPREAEMVEELIQCNGLQDRLSMHRCAVCDEVGSVQFQSGDASFTGILDKAVESKPDTAAATVTVHAVTLDSFVYGQGHPAPDLIKLDVESAEPLVIAGARRLLEEKRPRLVIEVHGPDASRDTVAQLLGHSYRVDLLTEQGRIPVTAADQLRPRFRKNQWTHHLLAVPK
jgi:FkbM family methyltransferase